MKSLQITLLIAFLNSATRALGGTGCALANHGEGSQSGTIPVASLCAAQVQTLAHHKDDTIASLKVIPLKPHPCTKP